jgi:hypothetical protein
VHALSRRSFHTRSRFQSNQDSHLKVKLDLRTAIRVKGLKYLVFFHQVKQKCRISPVKIFYPLKHPFILFFALIF